MTRQEMMKHLTDEVDSYRLKAYHDRTLELYIVQGTLADILYAWTYYDDSEGEMIDTVVMKECNLYLELSDIIHRPRSDIYRENITREKWYAVNNLMRAITESGDNHESIQQE